MTSEESVLLFSSFSESGIGTKEYSALFESLCRYGERKFDPILRPDKDRQFSAFVPIEAHLSYPC